jgi:uncharacterized BrkB/YihY/UPF0761 family membrane protein
MSAQVYPVTQKTAKPIVAGVFNILIGSFCMLGVLGLGIAAAVVVPVTNEVPFSLPVLLIIIAMPLAILGILAIIGGVFELQRKMWGWALAGSIAAACASTALGIAAIVLTAVSRDEFTH